MRNARAARDYATAARMTSLRTSQVSSMRGGSRVEWTGNARLVCPGWRAIGRGPSGRQPVRSKAFSRSISEQDPEKQITPRSLFTACVTSRRKESFDRHDPSPDATAG